MYLHTQKYYKHQKEDLLFLIYMKYVLNKTRNDEKIYPQIIKMYLAKAKATT